jgi:hypothetical protein
MSISRYLDFGVTGLVLVEPALEEYMRSTELDEIISGQSPGLGLRIQHRDDIHDSEISFIHDRWPRVSYQIGKLN